MCVTVSDPSLFFFRACVCTNNTPTSTLPSILEIDYYTSSRSTTLDYIKQNKILSIYITTTVKLSFVLCDPPLNAFVRLVDFVQKRRCPPPFIFVQQMDRSFRYTECSIFFFWMGLVQKSTPNYQSCKIIGIWNFFFKTYITAHSFTENQDKNQAMSHPSIAQK